MITNKKLSKIEKILGKELLIELEACSIADLKDRIVNGESAIKTVRDELEANPKYQDLKDSLKALSEALKEVKKFQKAIIDYSISLLEDKGQE